MTPRRPHILLTRLARDEISRQTVERLPLETGGILLGYREGSDVIVTHALPVDSREATASRYVRDSTLANVHLRKFLQNREPDDPIGYVGEWHSHPQPVGPSSLDLAALSSIARVARQPVALLIFAPQGTTQFSGVVATRRFGFISALEATVDLVEAQRTLGALPTTAVRRDGPVFISYRQSDGSVRADSFEGLLRASGLVVWRDHSDLLAGTTTDRLEQALTHGLSGGVLIVTPEIALSTVVKDRELPRLVQLDESPGFSLAIANEIPGASNPDKPDYSAPDRLLGLAPLEVLAKKKQSNGRTSQGRLEVVRDLLMHRVEYLKSKLSSSGVLAVTIQSRTDPLAIDAGDSDLNIRLRPAASGRLPSATGLRDLQSVLPITSDAIWASRAATVRVGGGAHLSIALAVGAALPETRLGKVVAVDVQDNEWTSWEQDDPGEHIITTRGMDTGISPDSAVGVKIAVFVTLTENPDTTAFDRLVRDAAGAFASGAVISLSGPGRIDPREAARLSKAVASEIKRLSAHYGRAEVHLAYHGPFPLALLIGRYLNTVRTVIYEWDNPTGGSPVYVPVLRLDPGVVHGPISEVLLSDVPLTTGA